MKNLNIYDNDYKKLVNASLATGDEIVDILEDALVEYFDNRPELVAKMNAIDALDIND